MKRGFPITPTTAAATSSGAPSRRIGVAAAKRLMFTADMIDAAEAARIGLASLVVPAERFEAEVEALAALIGTVGGP